MKVTVTDATQISSGYYCLFNSSNSVSALPYTMSAELAERTTPGLEIGIGGFGSIESTHPSNLNLGKIGDRYFKTIQYESGWKYEIGVRINLDFSFKNGDYIIIRKPQIEEKPYATSFVIGSRPNGRTQIVNSRFDKTNFVLAQWKKIISDGSSITRIGEYTADNSLFYIYFGVYNSYDNLFLYFNGVISNKTIVDIRNEWVFEVLIVDDLRATYKIMGENIDETLSVTYSIAKPYTHKIEYLVGPTNSFGLFSNFYVGKYRKPNGDIIWTDDYIREVYEAKIPFPVSNKLSIY